MNVYMAGYQAISILHGGPNTQLQNTAKHLAAFNVQTRLFDPWTRFVPKECDAFHLFAANIGTYHLAREIHDLGVPLVVSPIVFSLHSPSFVRTVLGMTRAAQLLGRGIWSDYALTSDICGWAKAVLPNTRAEASLLEHGFRVEKSIIEVVPNGVDERFLTADADLFRKKYGVDNFILNVGHTGHSRKNVLRLIKALARIDHPAVIIGRIIRNEYGEACVREASKHKHILLIDGLEYTSDLLASAYAACDTFVLPSLFETPGIAALEAGLTGANIVITRFGGTEEYFGDMAEYVDPRSIESIGDGIRKVLGRKRDDRLKNHIRNEFLWSRVAEKTANVYRRLAHRQ